MKTENITSEKIELNNYENNVKNEDKREFHPVENYNINSTPKEHKVLKIVGIILLTIFILLILAFSIFTIINYNNKKIISGVYIKNIDVSNLTVEEAKEKVTNYINNNLPENIGLKHNDYETSIPLSSLNVQFDVDTAVNSAMQGAQAGSMFGPIGASAGAAIGLVTSLASSIAKIHDSKNEKRIERLQDQIDTLDRSYDNLGRSIEEAYSKDASNLINQQNKLLEQQKLLIQNQIKEEQDKKKTDDERIKEWQNQIEDINQTIEDNKQSAVDAIFGEDVQSAIENFSSSLADAWANGTDASKSARDVVRQMMQQMVTESVKSAIKASGQMEQIRKKLQEFYADNVLTGWEQDYIYNMADKLQEELDKQFDWASDLFKNEEEGSSSQQSASSRGFGTEMTHEDAGELSGRFTALQITGEESKEQLIQISQFSKMLVDSNMKCVENIDGLVNLTIISNQHLENIAKHTRLLVSIEDLLVKIEDHSKNL